MTSVLEWIFNELDKDKSGFIEGTEINMVHHLLGFGHPGSDMGALFQDLCAQADSNKDGKISKDEFVAWMTGEKSPIGGLYENAVGLKNEIAHKMNIWNANQQAADAVVDDVEEIPLDGNAPAAKATAKVSKEQLDKLKQRFNELDADRNGQLSKAESVHFIPCLTKSRAPAAANLRLCCAHVCLTVGDFLLIDGEDLEKLWKAADSDGDGAVTFDEVRELVSMQGPLGYASCCLACYIYRRTRTFPDRDSRSQFEKQIEREASNRWWAMVATV